MKSLSFEIVKSRVKDIFGDIYEMPLQPYVSSKTPLRFICKEHGEFFRNSNSMLSKKWACKACGPGRGGSNKFTAEKVLADLQSKFPTFGFPDFFETYKDTQHKIDVVCPTHGLFQARPANLRLEKGGCPKCNVEAFTLARRHTKEDFIKKAEKIHGKLYDYSKMQYITSTEKVEIVCAVHGSFWQVAGSHITLSAEGKAIGCRQCGIERRGLLNKVTFDEFVSRARAVHQDTYQYLEASYIQMTESLDIVCPIHGVFKQVGTDHVHSKAGCPKCANQISKGEEAVRAYLTSLGLNVVANHKYSSRKEMDAYIPDRHFAVEFDGLPWHSTKYKTMRQQTDKTKELTALNIRLVRIFEDEWNDKHVQVQNLLSTQLGLNQERIYARSCAISDVTDEEARVFHSENNIQDGPLTGTHKCLTYNGKLVAVMTLTKHAEEPTTHELARFSSNLRVVGGASRLLKHLAKAVNAKNIVAYSENRLFSGKMYEALGFKEVAKVQPSYTYWCANVNTKTRQHKSEFKDLPAKLENYNPQLTEKQNCENNGYYQIYDDGLTKWELTV